MSTRLPASATAVLVLLLVGCPEGGTRPGPQGTATVTSGVPASGKITKRPAKPRPEESPSADPFPRDALRELYAADMSGDPEARRRAQQRHGLLDEKGVEVHARVQEYEAAIRRLAEGAPDAWSALVEGLTVATVTSVSGK